MTALKLHCRGPGRDGSMKMLLAGVFNSVPDGYKFRFGKDGIVFQKIPWNIPSDNYLFFGKNQFIAHDVALRDRDNRFLSTVLTRRTRARR